MYLAKWNIPLRTSYAYGSNEIEAVKAIFVVTQYDMISRNWTLSTENNRQLTEFPSIFVTSDYL